MKKILLLFLLLFNVNKAVAMEGFIELIFQTPQALLLIFNVILDYFTNSGSHSSENKSEEVDPIVLEESIKPVPEGDV